MALKEYQKDVLDVLEGFFAAARNEGLPAAFARTQARQDRRLSAYLPVEALPETPFVCLKVPTGGGKTLLAAASLPRVAKTFGQENPVVLWLVPTKTIRDQTLRQLRNPRSLVRSAIDPHLRTPTVLDVAEALETGVADYAGGPVIIVATLAAFRVEDKEGRKVYESSGALMDHFENLPPELAGVPIPDDDGVPLYSLANVLRLRRPLIVVDEAHKARTRLAFETFARFAPTAILEFTATPVEPAKHPKGTDAPPSNVLIDVPAYRLKDEETIKAPLELRLEPQWQKAITESLAMRGRLEDLAEPEGLRPVLLIQCEPKNGDLSWPTVLAHLTGEEKLSSEWIAVSTGERDDLPADLANSAVRVVLTVDKLREGWDCPQAYVLCALRDLKSHTAIEQTLGRVMRQPNVRRFKESALNRAYIYARGDRFSVGAAGNEIVQALEGLGFSRWEAQNSVETPQEAIPGLGVEKPVEGGLFAEAEASGPERRAELLVPQLTIDYDGVREVAERDHFLIELHLSKFDAELPEFTLTAETGGAVIDVSKVSRWSVATLAEAVQFRALLDVKTPVTRERLVSWLDRAIPHPEIDARQSLTWLGRVVDGLLSRGLTLEQLWAERIRVKDAAGRKMRLLIREEFGRAAQGFLFDPPDEGLGVDPLFTHEFPERYDIPRRYEGQYRYEKHLYRTAIGDMDGEEALFAYDLDGEDAVEYWVRNVERTRGAFWLPTSTDRFYPDFVAKLTDGRTAIFEYKGEGWRDTDDSREKEKIGKVYQERSDGLCVFELLGKRDYRQRMRGAIRGLP